MILILVILLGLFTLTGLHHAFRRLQKKDTKKQLDLAQRSFFYRYLHQIFFQQQEYEGLLFATSFTQNMLRFCYAFLSILLLLQTHVVLLGYHVETGVSLLSIDWPFGILSLIGLFFILFIIGDYIPRLLGTRFPEIMIHLCAFPASIFLFLVFPFTFISLKLSNWILNGGKHHSYEPEEEAKQEIIDLIEESNVGFSLDPHDKKLIESVMEFKDRIAREIMVPRVDVYSLQEETTIREAAIGLQQEGYSRVPIYKDTLDNIIGVLMYKDLLAKYMEFAQTKQETILDTPISSLMKNVIYTPETKKISHLLQEFRKKQVHLAIVVDEYGGTEGIVTIEDILEQIVGEIADEYDEEVQPFIPLPEGGWLIDARMGILDIDEQFGIEIPQDGDYDTISGYIFHEAGTIPEKGFILKKPQFEIEVIRSNDRIVEKVRIKPFTSLNDNSPFET
jgi:CBS domain containing-hemolysin-like protein